MIILINNQNTLLGHTLWILDLHQLIEAKSIHLHNGIILVQVKRAYETTILNTVLELNVVSIGKVLTLVQDYDAFLGDTLDDDG